MPVIDTPTPTVSEKRARVEKLLGEIKGAVAEGRKDAEQQAELSKKMDEVRELGGEIKAAAEQSKAIGEAEALLADTKAYDATSNQPGIPAEITDTKAIERSFDPRQQYIKLNNERATQTISGAQTKALNQGAGGGNFLVPPAWMQDLFAQTRRQGNALRRFGLLNEHPVETSVIYIPQGSGAASVGWVAENATKPSADQAYSQLTVNVFTLAGISKVSLQLVQDSNPTAADLVARELGSLIGNAEELAIINGTGTGQPKGILNITAGNLASATTTSTSNTAQFILTDIINMIAAVAQNYYAAPNAIVMHPKRLAYLMRAQDSQNNFIFNPAGNFRAPGGLGGGDVLNGVDPETASLFGLPVIVSTNMPTTLAGGSNADAIIVGNFDEAHWFQRMELTLDASDVAGTAFESNQVWYRLEERVGFTAERYPKAFAYSTGNATGYNS